MYRPDLAKIDLYQRSGHWEHYHEDMFPPVELETEQMVLRPMNCPHHILIYNSKMHSYRGLPVRIAELGAIYRYERSGVFSGLSRVRCMTLNDAHIFCTPEQIKEEFTSVMRLVEEAYKDLGITKYSYRLSLGDRANKEKYVENDAMWELGEHIFGKRWMLWITLYVKRKAKRPFTDRSSIFNSLTLWGMKKLIPRFSWISTFRSVQAGLIGRRWQRRAASNDSSRQSSALWSGYFPI